MIFLCFIFTTIRSYAMRYPLGSIPLYNYNLLSMTQSWMKDLTHLFIACSLQNMGEICKFHLCGLKINTIQPFSKNFSTLLFSYVKLLGNIINLQISV